MRKVNVRCNAPKSDIRRAGTVTQRHTSHAYVASAHADLSAGARTRSLASMTTDAHGNCVVSPKNSGLALACLYVGKPNMQTSRAYHTHADTGPKEAYSRQERGRVASASATTFESRPRTPSPQRTERGLQPAFDTPHSTWQQEQGPADSSWRTMLAPRCACLLPAHACLCGALKQHKVARTRAWRACFSCARARHPWNMCLHTPLPANMCRMLTVVLP